MIGVGTRKIDFLMSNIKISAEDHRLTLGAKLIQPLMQRPTKGDFVIDAAPPILAIGKISTDEPKFRQLHGQHATLNVKLFLPYPTPHVEGFFLSEDACAGITLFGARRIPVLIIGANILNFFGNLGRVRAHLLQHHRRKIFTLDPVPQALLGTRANSVNVPSCDPHGDRFYTVLRREANSRAFQGFLTWACVGGTIN